MDLLGRRKASLLAFIVFSCGLTGCLSEQIACLHTRGSKLDISCPNGQVIMNPKVKVGKSSWITEDTAKKCRPNRRDDCFGTTPEVLAQTNSCHFLQRCSVVLNPMMPITNSENRSCLAKTPDYAILLSHECVCETTLKFACSSQNTHDSMVRTMEGMLVSHQNYPWFYPKEPQTCQVIFSASSKHKLTIWTEDIHLDPEGRDNVSLYNSTVPGNRELIAAYSANNFNETFIDSTIEVVFYINRETKAGRGFVLSYKWSEVDDKHHKTDKEKNCTQKSVDPSQNEPSKTKPSETKPSKSKPPSKKPSKRRENKRGKKRKNRKKGRKNRRRTTRRNPKSRKSKKNRRKHSNGRRKKKSS